LGFGRGGVEAAPYAKGRGGLPEKRAEGHYIGMLVVEEGVLKVGGRLTGLAGRELGCGDV